MGVCEGECMGHNPGDKPQTLTRCRSCGSSQLYKAFGWKSACDRANSLKGIKLKIYFFFLKLFSFCSSFHGMMRVDLAVAGGIVV